MRVFLYTLCVRNSCRLFCVSVAIYIHKSQPIETDTLQGARSPPRIKRQPPRSDTLRRVVFASVSCVCVLREAAVRIIAAESVYGQQFHCRRAGIASFLYAKNEPSAAVKADQSKCKCLYYMFQCE